MTGMLAEAVDMLQGGQIAEASQRFTQLLSAEPDNHKPWHYLGIVALKEREFERAARLFEKALTLRPQSPEIHHNLGAAYRVLGQLDKAEHHYREALERNPDYAEAYFNLSGVRKFNADDPEPIQVARLLLKRGLSDSDRCFLHFAAGKMHDDLGNYDLAFKHYRRGNKARDVTFDPEAYATYVQRLIEVFDARRVRLRENEPPAELPVFVIGMPRSGTTLVEQILSSHPDVFGAGELPDIASIAGTLPQHTAGDERYPDCVPHLPMEAFRGFGDAYQRRLRSFSETAQRIINKTPMNFEFLGLIAMLVPGARVIHCRRDPLDTCLSCYFQRFRSGQEFSYTPEDLAFYYGRYRQLMRHWHQVLPTSMLEVDYETLVQQPESTVRALVDYCGLAWDERCLRFHETERPVTTASNWQVRQPLYTSAIRRSDRYEAHLEPFRRALAEQPLT
jgi:tetratricopeptide (TPR) repeat protein